MVNQTSDRYVVAQWRLKTAESGVTTATGLFTVLMGLSYRKFKVACRRLVHILTMPDGANCPVWLAKLDLSLPDYQEREIMACDLLKAITQAVYTAYAKRDSEELAWLFNQAETLMATSKVFKRHKDLIDRLKVDLMAFDAIIQEARQAGMLKTQSVLAVVHKQNGRKPSRKDYDVAVVGYVAVKQTDDGRYYLS